MNSSPQHFRRDDIEILTKLDLAHDWSAAASPIPPAPRLDSAERNPAGLTRMDMVRELLGPNASGDDAALRSAFCREFSRRGGWAIDFDAAPVMTTNLYFESRFDEWGGNAFPVAGADGLRLDGDASL
ncbi:hypothetical protein [Teichococcus wenyumeiae]|nr:hypothetical protein [Pseudoroseomonas wenyumeiae]RKK03320.1 hypothetical protein D6Z83_15285 [Pseudoroseomonas wenyumeiae]